jgi:hypothetical protein
MMWKAVTFTCQNMEIEQFEKTCKSEGKVIPAGLKKCTLQIKDTITSPVTI